ncbi:MAG: cation:dicarboxylase symporter family transporter [Coriobacteriales bacterium]|nr:cation:dicarboxylase symporter family transporter [Coriobacteriales bacterium]
MKEELLLDARGIERASAMVGTFLVETGMSKREAITGQYSFENVLLMWREHYGDGVPATIKAGKWFGKPSMSVAVRGERLDPRGIDTYNDDEYASFARSMLGASGFTPTYSYRGGYNIVTLTRPRPPLSSLAQILIAFLLGLAISLMGNFFLSQTDRTYALEKFVTPLFDVFLAMLGGLAGPLIFLTVAWGVCGIGDVTALGRSGKSLVGRFLRDNGLATLFACVVCIPFFSLSTQGVGDSGDFFGDLLQMIIDLLPTNVVGAFADGNTSQIIILGVFVGIAALVLGNACSGVRKGIEELNALAQFLMEQLCRLLPAFIFVMVLSQVWSGTFMTLLTAWLPFLLVIVLVVVFFGLRIAYTSLRFHIPIKKILMAVRPAMTLGLTTASSCAAFGAMVSGCRDELGVGEEQTSFGIPLGMVLCQPPTILMLVALMMHCMQMYGLGADLTWYVRMALLCFLYSMVAPPVPGGMIVCFGLMFAKLGIPAEALAMATAFSIVVDYVVTCFRVGSIMIGVFDSGCALGDVDRSTFEDMQG